MTKTFDVVGKKKYFYIFSCVIIALSIILSFVIKTNIAIEFKGGTIVTYSYTGELTDSAVATAAKEATALECNVTFGESLADGLKTVSIVFPASEGISAEVQSNMTDALAEKFPENALELYNSPLHIHQAGYGKMEALKKADTTRATALNYKALHFYLTFPKIRHELWPPKPKVLFIATFTPLC